MNNMVLNELYNKIIDLDLSEYTHQKLYDLCFKLDDKIEELRALYESEREVKEDYKSRNNKAIEYINKKAYSNISKSYDELYNGQIEELVEILKGE